MMPALAKRFVFNHSAATAVEFALVVGPFCLLVFGTVEFGRAYWAKQALSEVAATASRCVAIPEPDCATTSTYSASKTLTAVKNAAAAKGLTLTTSNVTVNRAATCAGLSGFTTVSLSYTFQSPLKALIEPMVGGMNFTTSACFPNQ